MEKRTARTIDGANNILIKLIMRSSWWQDRPDCNEAIRPTPAQTEHLMSFFGNACRCRFNARIESGNIPAPVIYAQNACLLILSLLLKK